MLFFFFNLKLIKILSFFFLISRTHFVQSREEFMFYLSLNFFKKIDLFTLILLRFDIVVCFGYLDMRLSQC
jgi:hypothetical protein